MSLSSLTCKCNHLCSFLNVEEYSALCYRLQFSSGSVWRAGSVSNSYLLLKTPIEKYHILYARLILSFNQKKIIHLSSWGVSNRIKVNRRVNIRKRKSLNLRFKVWRIKWPRTEIQMNLKQWRKKIDLFLGFKKRFKRIMIVYIPQRATSLTGYIKLGMHVCMCVLILWHIFQLLWPHQILKMK